MFFVQEDSKDTQNKPLDCVDQLMQCSSGILKGAIVELTL